MQTPTPENILTMEHQSWLKHPVTIQMLRNLDKNREAFVNVMISNVGIGEDAFFHRHTMAIKTINGVKSWITKTEQFVTLSEQ